jgi:CDP-glucose 4,6-dehydratase
VNVLVTGAAGFIGANLIDQLAKQGAKVFGLVHDRMQNGHALLREAGLFTTLAGDVCDLRRMLEVIVDREIDLIYHLAAKSIVRNCRLDPLGCLATNVLGTATVLEAARQSERVQGILCAESDKSYGPGQVPYREDQALLPQAVYEASKACVSHVCAAYWHNYGLPVVTVRTANVYGERDPNRSRLVPNTICRLLAGQAPQITAGAAEFRREFVYVGDVCAAYQRVLESGLWGEAFNIGSGECYTVSEAVEMIARVMGQSFALPEAWARPATLVEIPDQRVCSEKLRGIWPGFQPRRMVDTLPDIVEWYRQNCGETSGIQRGCASHE